MMKMPARLDREYRNIILANFETRTADDGQRIVEGYATTFNSPYELYDDSQINFSEEIDARAFDDCDMSDVILQYDHMGRVFARGSNRTLEVRPDDHGLFIRARLDGTEIGRQLYDEIAAGYTTRMSMGFRVAIGGDTRVSQEDENGKLFFHRTITRIAKLYDVSAVSLPANDQTEISARNLRDGVIEEIRAERLAAAQRARDLLKLRLMLTEV